MIYGLDSSKRVIAKLFRDFKRGYTAEYVNDTIEWIGEALESIGYYGQTVKKITGINGEPPTLIKYNRGNLPCDLYLINNVSYKGFTLPYGSGDFNYAPNTDLAVSKVEANKVSTDTSFTGNIIQLGLDSSDIIQYTNESYIIQPGYIKTSFSDGQVFIDYEAFVIDEDGFPMIPANFEFRDACTKYCIMKLIESGLEHPVWKHADAEIQWEWAQRRAETKANIPDNQRMESFIHQWVRMIPNIRPDQQFYSQMGTQEDFR